jgi:hypothetical protein
MDFQRQQQRIGILCVVLCLLIVVVWRMFSPDIEKYRTYKREARLKQVMQEILPPSEARVVSIQTFHLGKYPWGLGLYSYDSDFDRVKTHYMQEFGRRSFTYKGERDRPGSPASYQFCAQEYNAILTRMNVQMYSIDWKNTPC